MEAAVGSSKQKVASARWLSAIDGEQKGGAARVQAGVDRKRKQPAMEAQKRVDALVGAAAGLKQKAVTGTRAAMWKQLIPDVRQSASNGGATIMERIGGFEEWGRAKKRVVTARQGRNSSIEAPADTSFREFAGMLRRDFVLASKSDATWKQYDGWKRCFWAWLDVYGLDFAPSKDPEIWNLWVDVLSDAVAVMAVCYSVGTLDVLVSAVSAYMQHGGMASPFASKEFGAMMEGIRRWKGLGKKKKPPVEPWHVRAVLSGQTASYFRGGEFSKLQLIQARLLLVLGWQLFCRPQDFYELEVCDFRFEEG